MCTHIKRAVTFLVYGLLLWNKFRKREYGFIWILQRDLPKGKKATTTTQILNPFYILWASITAKCLWKFVFTVVAPGDVHFVSKSVLRDSYHISPYKCPSVQCKQCNARVLLQNSNIKLLWFEFLKQFQGFPRPHVTQCLMLFAIKCEARDYPNHTTLFCILKCQCFWTDTALKWGVF